ncbi:MAG: hypothetical protein U1E05_04315 [Patescibacteria group bacterium]|nr:hypothetical protein [Patescibacteria group bacterium]
MAPRSVLMQLAVFEGASLAYINTPAASFGGEAAGLQLQLGSGVTYPFAGGTSSNMYAPRWQDVTVNGEYTNGEYDSQHFGGYEDGYLAGEVLLRDFVRPDDNGLLTLAVSTGVNEYGYINALVITLLPEPSTGLLLVLGVVCFAHCGDGGP